MPAFFRSLRFRLVLVFVLVFGFVQVVLSVAALLVGESHLRERFDEELIQRSEAMGAEVLRAQGKLFAPDVKEVVRREALSAIFRDFYVELRDAQGKSIQRSANLGAYQLPLDPSVTVEARPGATHLETLLGPESQPLAGERQRLRMVSRYLAQPGEKAMILQVAASLERVDLSVTQMRQLLLVGLVVGLVAAALASWFIADRAARKIEAVSDLAQRVQPHQLGPRLSTSDRSDEIGQMVRHVNDMLDRLEAGFAAQERFVHDASHELKTPLSAMVSEAQVLKMIQPTPEQCRLFIDSVEQEARHLARLTDSLLLLAANDHDKPVLTREVMSVNDLVESVADQCAAAARQRGVRLTLRLLESERSSDEMKISGDANLMGVMVSNLIRNAVSFSPAEESVEVEVGKDGDTARIEVRDRGPGVPPEMVDKVFDRFVQADVGRPRRGTGLGLAIARTIARLHGGDIRLSNLKPVGCALTITLPLVRDEQPKD